MAFSFKEVAVIEHRKLTREEVAAVFDIPQMAIGILDHSPFSDVHELHQMPYVDTSGH